MAGKYELWLQRLQKASRFGALPLNITVDLATNRVKS
jgi:hypothetical protein